MRILDYGEGIVTNWGTHLIDVAQLINGTERSGPVAVEGRGNRPPEGSLWNTLTDFELHYRYANGVTLEYRMDVPFLRVEGDEGWIQAHWNSPGGLKASDRTILTTKLRPDEVRVPNRGDKADFISAIRDGVKVMADAEVGHRTCSVGQIGHIAIQTGRRLTWDPTAEQFQDDPDANEALRGRYRGEWRVAGA
jgi:predicted dehydrogenase